MFTVNNHEYSWLIRQRAAERHARTAARKTREDATRVYIPFVEWLYFTTGVSDWKQLRPHRKWELYNDYILFALKLNMEWEYPEKYGVKNTLY